LWMMIDDTTATAVNQLRRLDEELETILTSFDTSYAWNYGSVKEGLRDLYEKAKRDQWNGTTQLAWDTDVDPERGIIPDVINPLIGYPPYERLTPKEKNRLRHAQIALQLSQFLHGEQGALIVASQLVGAVPWIDAKYYAGTQTMDAFGNMFQITQEPLLKELVRYVMKDESRHVAFGMLSLAEFYRDIPPAELRDREDFIIYACELMRNRLVGDQISSAMGWDREEVKRVVLDSAPAQMFRRMLFARVVPNLRRLGLLTPRVREAFAGLGILEFEHADPEAQDRALGLA